MKFLKNILEWISNLIDDLLDQKIILAFLCAGYFAYSDSHPSDKTEDLVAGAFVILAIYSLFNKELKIWGAFRAIGIIIFVGQYIAIRKESQGANVHIHLLWMLICLIAIIGGEIALYLHKLTEFMICPRCVGKGFVDKNDITRLGMEGGWSQGYCRYCDGKGKVDIGKTKWINPRSFIGPSSHESDTPGN